MVRFQAASGNVAAKLVARGKHFVLFDEPADKGAILKESYPDLGWTTSIEGHPTLPYSVAWRLLLRGCAERDRRDVLLFGEFATAQLFSRIWKAVVPTFNFTADNPFSEVSRVVASLPNKNAFIFVAGDWEKVQDALGDDWDATMRFVNCVTRGDVFQSTPTATSGLAGAELGYYSGPYMLKDLREAEGCHFKVATRTIGKLYESDGDEDLCDGRQLASEVSEGLVNSIWPELLMHTTEGNDSTQLMNQQLHRIFGMRVVFYLEN